MSRVLPIEPLLRPEDAAGILGVSADFIVSEVRAGNIPAINLGNSRRVIIRLAPQDVREYHANSQLRITERKGLESRRETQKAASRVSTYFIQAVGGGPIKIGRSRDPHARVKNLQVGHVGRLTIRRIVAGNHEKHFHSLFSALRIDGEWFKPEGALAEFLKDGDGQTT